MYFYTWMHTHMCIYFIPKYTHIRSHTYTHISFYICSFLKEKTASQGKARRKQGKYISIFSPHYQWRTCPWSVRNAPPPPLRRPCPDRGRRPGGGRPKRGGGSMETFSFANEFCEQGAARARRRTPSFVAPGARQRHWLSGCGRRGLKVDCKFRLPQAGGG